MNYTPYKAIISDENRNVTFGLAIHEIIAQWDIFHIEYCEA